MENQQITALQSTGGVEFVEQNQNRRTDRIAYTLDIHRHPITGNSDSIAVALQTACRLVHYEIAHVPDLGASQVKYSV